MATIITSDCINCGACEPECPNTAIYAGGVPWDLGGASNPAIAQDIFYIVPSKCTECVGFYDHEACAAVCPVDCCVPDPNNPETPESVLLDRARALHPELTFANDAPSRFRKEGGEAAPARRNERCRGGSHRSSSGGRSSRSAEAAAGRGRNSGGGSIGRGIRSGDVGRARHLQGLQRAVLDPLSACSRPGWCSTAQLLGLIRAELQAVPQRARGVRGLLRKAAAASASAWRRVRRRSARILKRAKPPRQTHSRNSCRIWRNRPSQRAKW